MRIGIVAVQGAFAEHGKLLEKLNAGLILPGGESTVQGKLLRELDMFAPLKAEIQEGLPVLATCAGLILLAEKLSNDDHVYFGTMPVTVRRNAYGRQLGSFHTRGRFAHVGEIPMTFIRAPSIDSVSEDAEILAQVDGHIVGAAYKNQMGISFHPELDCDPRIHQMFLNRI